MPPRRPDLNLYGCVFGSQDVCDFARISPRQLQWWDERKLISPRHQSHRRVYDAVDVVSAMLVAELRRKGLSLQKIRQLLRPLRAALGRLLGQTGRDDRETYLLTEGTTLHFENDPARVIARLGKCRQPMFVLSVSDSIARVAKSATAAAQRNLRDRQLSLF